MAEMMPDDGAFLPVGEGRGPVGRVLARLVEWWALAGGAVLLAVVVMNSASVFGAFAANLPVPGDFELTEMGICIAAFGFLPYCQMVGANVTADIFTEGAGPRLRGVFAFAAALVALLFASLLLWRMWAGMLDKMEYGETTAILQLPHWPAYLPILVSLALLAAASLMSLGDAWRAIRGR
ncbi:MAG: TRAP-type C4-dicarboxylate transport system permease small subunit [Paracoccaceae bacterium]|jgi:TRAP-type C4-dicarboxylate transport system permease small subunit